MTEGYIPTDRGEQPAPNTATPGPLNREGQGEAQSLLFRLSSRRNQPIVALARSMN